VTTVAETLRTAVSLSGARRCLAQEFRRCGLETPDLDARLLLASALGLDHAALAARANQTLSPDDAAAIAALAARRLAREPVARILGMKEFWGLPLRLDADTLVPRPETETVVEAALTAIDRDHRRSEGLRVADLGTGSGALVLALISELPAAFGVGTDVSVAALACARRNAAACGLAARTAFVACDWGAALDGPFDLLVSNPPYVARNEIAALPPEVRDFDPHRALDGGTDGLAGYRAIAGEARRLLASGGTLVVELGAGQAAAVTSLLSAAGLAPISPAWDDLGGVTRALAMRPLP
jgi:release factor glutamine methyltransferase